MAIDQRIQISLAKTYLELYHSLRLFLANLSLFFAFTDVRSTLWFEGFFFFFFKSVQVSSLYLLKISPQSISYTSISIYLLLGGPKLIQPPKSLLFSEHATFFDGSHTRLMHVLYTPSTVIILLLTFCYLHSKCFQTQNHADVCSGAFSHYFQSLLNFFK